MSLNRCEFIGHLGADPEVRRMASGDPVVSLRVAVTEKWRGRDGERKERTEWIPVTIFNEHLAKFAEQYLRKGSKVFVAGSWQSRKWTDQSGQDRWTTECVLQKFRSELEILDSKGEGASQRAPAVGGYGQEQSGYAADLDDEIPF